MESLITQCPHCGTSFKINGNQLSAANGSVRCGACLQVFSARNHIVNAPATSKATKAKPAAAKPQANKQPAKPKPMQSSGFEADSDEQSDFLFDDNNGFSADDDDEEFIFGADEDDNSDEEFSFEKDTSSIGDLSDSFLELGGAEQNPNNPFSVENNQTAPEEEIPDTDESWAEDILDEISNDFAATPSQNGLAQKPAPKAVDKKPAPAKAQVHQKLAAPEIEQPDPVKSDPFKPRDVVSNLDHNEFDLEMKPAGRSTNTLFTIGVLILLIGAFGQFMWVKKDTLAKQDNFRPYYVKFCKQFNCTLPEQVDLSAIKIRNMSSLLDHSKYKNAKSLDFFLINNAGFEQPFPQLILTFDDIKGNLIADQQFSPSSYLNGELAGATNMPINTQIHISLSIRDPGAQAVNYKLLFK